MRTYERTWDIDLPRTCRSQDRDSGADAHDGEQAEHRDDQRHSAESTDQASEPGPRLPRRAIDREVGEERVEFAVGPSCVQRFKPLFKLVTAEPPLSRRAPQSFSNLLPIGV
jgi:hypothetical protein